MTTEFLHGVQVQDIDDGSRTVSVSSSSVIGIVGTAPFADPVLFPLNTPVTVTSPTLAASLVSAANAAAAAAATTAQAAAVAAGTSTTIYPAIGTLSDALDSIFDQAGAAVVVVRVDVGATDQLTMVNVIGGVDVTTGNYEGVHAFLAAQHLLNLKPRILIAPGFTHIAAIAGGANAVVSEMIGIATTLRAVIFQDGPSTVDADALALAAVGGSQRIYLVDPMTQKVDSSGNVSNSWASAAFAGVQAYVDNAFGWWCSVSNNVINGIVGTSRVIDFAMGNPTSRANLLNAGNVGTIIRQNGFRTWGNRTLSADPKWQFLCVVRTADIIADSLQDAHLWAVDQGITKNYVSEVQEGINAFLRGLVTLGAILGGTAWVDPDLNSAANIANGDVFWDFDFTPTYPAENLTFRSHLVNDYVSTIF